jgi:small subunit ribosomal protein S2
VLFVLDVGYEKNAIKEAKKLGIPVVGIVDSNNSPTDIDYIIPGNDDSIRAVKLYCQSVSAAVLEAKTAGLDIAINKDDFVEENVAPVEENVAPVEKNVAPVETKTTTEPEQPTSEEPAD